MIITSIELKGFKRMALSNISLFRMEPKQRVQLILGTNGSGKSSLLSELTPLPAQAADYHKDGYKKITIVHKGSTYVLESIFGNQPLHRFWKDDVNLNATVGTLMVQRELVFQEFGITQQLHEIITGAEKFTRMSPAARRELFTKLNEVDFSYAVGLYNRIKERHRDIQGALKRSKQRLVTETSKIVKQEEMDRLQAVIDDLVEKLNQLYAVRNDERRSIQEIELEQTRLLADMTRTCDRFFRIRSSVLGHHTWWLPAELEATLLEDRGEYARRAGQIDALTQEFVGLKQTYDAHQTTGSVGINQLREQLETLEARRTRLVENSRLKLHFDRPAAARISLDSCYQDLLNIFSQIESNEDRRFSKDKLQELVSKEVEALGRISRGTSALDKIQKTQEHLDHIRAGTQTTCPQCSHSWHIGYSEKEYQNTVKNLETGNSFVAAARAELVGIQEELVKIREYQALITQYLVCVSRHAALNPFWEYLGQDELISRSPKTVITKLQALHADLDDWQEIVQIDEDIRKNHNLTDLAIKASDFDIGRVSQRLSELENQLGVMASEQRRMQQRIDEQTTYLKRVEELFTLEAQVKSKLQQFDNGALDLARAMSNQVVNDCLRQLQIELSEKQRAFNDIKMQQGIITDIQTSIDTLTLEESVHKALVRELSPQDGLIAEGMLGFIRVFVSKMNQLIRKSWAYPMVILDCSTEGESADLDYKFPVLIGDNPEPSKDVSRTSAGQEDMINLAFRIVAMTYAKLENYWLVLDEFGNTFDETHKEKATVMIKALLEQLPFSQMYMVSHNAAQYLAFNNADVCVLNNIGVTTPKVYNQHVTIQ